MRTLALVALLCSNAACVIVPPSDEPDASLDIFPSVDAGFDAGFDGGGDGGGILPPLTNEGHGVGQLWLVRIDHGAANTASSVEKLVAAATKAIADARVDLVGSAVVSLYDPAQVIWAQNPKRASPVTITNALSALAAPDPLPVGGCPANMLFRMGSSLPALFANGTFAFPTPPAALFVGIVDEGARPVALADCPDALATFASDPSFWLQTGADLVSRLRIRIAWIATPESGTSAALRARCAGTPGVPPQVIDVLEPSPLAYYDPLLSSLSSTAPGLSTGLDLCSAFGDPASVGSAVSTWLSGLQLP